jgi:molecular chaperone GrpE
MKDREDNNQKDSGKQEQLEKESYQDEASSGDELEDLNLLELQKKASDYDSLWDKYLRLCADFDNSRKRWDKDRVDLLKFANYSLIADLVVIVDELEHALRAIKDHSSSEDILRGVEMTYRNLVTILKKQGLKAIEAKDKKFDPHVHEIVGQKEASDDKEHFVLEEVQKGYLLEDKLLRTSKVIIGIKKKEDIEEGKVEEETNSDREGLVGGGE